MNPPTLPLFELTTADIEAAHRETAEWFDSLPPLSDKDLNILMERHYAPLRAPKVPVETSEF